MPIGEVPTNGEVYEMKKMTADEWSQVRANYSDWQEKLYFVPLKVYKATAIISFFVYIFAGYTVVPVIVLIYSAYQWGKREFHEVGYMDGYSEGREKGINVAFGMNDKDAQEFDEMMSEISIRKEMDERIKK